MGLTVIDDSDKVSMMNNDGTWNKAQGGTELMNSALYQRVDNSLLEQFNIIKSRVRDTDPNKPNILWLHDLWNDPEALHLKEPESRSRFAKLVFVSNWQLTTYNMGLGVPYAESVVMKNAIEPIEDHSKSSDVIRLIYHTTPHRGLNIVYAAVAELAKTMGDKIHLDVFSSFQAYGWPERDEPFKPLFELIENHPNMTYHGFKPNPVVREALKEAHIFAYPSVWQETSCIAAIEAMSAGCEVVCPNLAALPETTLGYARMYQYSEDMNQHGNVFVNLLAAAIKQRFDDGMIAKLKNQKNMVDMTYNWDFRAAEWTQLLQAIKPEKKIKIL
jgi:UDP-glucose:(glucosyl)LPS alpha-1,2-glucosyltransferase